MTRSRHFIFIFILATCIEPSSSFGFHCQRRALKLGARELWRGPQCLPLVLGATREGGSWTTLCQRNTNACYSINTRLHLAGGFGAPPSKSSKKKQKRSNVAAAQDEISTASKSASVSSRQNKEPEPLLDRFGLPLVPTEEDIFPRMPPGTELISSSLNENDNIVTSQDQLDALLEKHMMINLTALHAMSASQYGRTNHMKVRMLHQSPPVISISNFFTDEECQDCINLVTAQNSGDEKGAAMQVNSATFSPLAQSKRTSTTWYMPYEHMPTLVTKLKHILCLKEGVKQFEEPQIVRYRKGEEFSWHYDEVPAAQLQNGGQRLATALVYLNTLPKIAGGGTIFRDLSSSAGGQGDQLTMRPQRGSLLLFFPAYKDGTPDDRTLHKGEVVASSAKEPKMITQMWIHERPYSPVVPKGNNHEAALPKVAELEQQLGF